MRYASPYSHLGLELSRRDDLIALGYFIHFIYNGSLPWQDDVNPNSSRCRVIAKKKGEFLKSLQVKLNPPEFATYMNYCQNLEYEEKPDYSYLKSLVTDIAKRERIDIQDKCFDWNILKASQYLYKDPAEFRDLRQGSQNEVKSYIVPTRADCNVLMLDQTIMQLARQQFFPDALSIEHILAPIRD